MTTRNPLTWLFLLIVVLAAPGCGDGAPTEAAADRAPGQLRVVSLSPAVTQMLIDLKLSERIVGVGQYDPVAPEHATVVGNLYQIDYERLLGLQPTHVFIQPERTAGPPGRLVSLAEQRDWQLRGYWMDTLQGTFDALTGPGGVGEALDMQTDAEALRAKVETKLAAIERITATRPPKSVLMLVGLEPLTAVGPGTFLDQLLATAGASNAAADFHIAYPVIGRERLLAMNPQVVVIIRGEGEATTGRIDPPNVLAALPLRAVADDRVMQLADPTALLPSTSVARVTGKMATLLHPQLAELLAEAVDFDE